MRGILDILTFFFSDRINPATRGAGMNFQDVFPVFLFGSCWKLVSGNCVCWVAWVRWVEGTLD